MNDMGWLQKLAAVCIAIPARAMGVTRGVATTARLTLGLATVFMLMMGPAQFSLAAALFTAGFLLARADATFKSDLQRKVESSPSPGDQYAFYTDIVCNALVFVGIGVGLHNSVSGVEGGGPVAQAPIAMGIFAAVAMAATPWLVKRLEVIDGRRSPEFDKIAGFDVGDIILIVPIALWAGWSQGLLLVIAFGGAAFAGGLYMAHFRKFHSMQ